MTIKAIETRYAGCRFRSRLEARWAVFFDQLGIRWEYEPQGYELGPLQQTQIDEMKLEWGDEAAAEHREHLGYYLPDFWLPGLGAWFEVKGARPTASEEARHFRFALLTGKPFFVAIGTMPDPRTFDSMGHPYADSFDIEIIGDIHYAWTQCWTCGLVGLTFDARSARLPCACHAERYKALDCCNGDKCYNGDAPAILDAYAFARSARFEHGEAG